MNSLNKLVGIIGLCLAPPTMGIALTYVNKSVGQLQSTYMHEDCVFFTLVGVSEADPVKPSDPWFAVSRTQFGAKDAYAMLLSAKLSGQTVTVRTNGTLSCGWASVEAITMQ